MADNSREFLRRAGFLRVTIHATKCRGYVKNVGINVGILRERIYPLPQEEYCEDSSHKFLRRVEFLRVTIHTAPNVGIT